MITTQSASTEWLEVPIEEIKKAREDLKQIDSIIESLKTSSEPQPFTLIPRIGLAYDHFLPILASQVDEPSLYKSAANYEALLDSIQRTFRQGIWPETLSSYPTLDLRTLERLYILRGRSEVIKFLVDNPFLFPFLQEAYEQIRNYFGNSAQVVLEVVTEPEVVGEQELVIFIRTNLSPDKVFEKLEQLGEDWWLDTPFNVLEKLCIDVEFE